MLRVEYVQYAPSYLKSIIADNKLDYCKAYASFKLEEENPFPSTRDRTEEMTKAVKGMAESDRVTIIDYTGIELCRSFNAMFRAENFRERFRFIFA